MSGQADDDLVASKTEGYKVGEKKTVEEYAKLGTQKRIERAINAIAVIYITVHLSFSMNRTLCCIRSRPISYNILLYCAIVLNQIAFPLLVQLCGETTLMSVGNPRRVDAIVSDAIILSV